MQIGDRVYVFYYVTGGGKVEVSCCCTEWTVTLFVSGEVAFRRAGRVHLVFELR